MSAVKKYNDLILNLPNFANITWIGEGTFSQVFKATDVKKNLPVVIKLSQLDDPSAQEIFLKESESLASVQHENIVNIYDSGFVDNHFYIVMEHINGKTLKEKMKEELSQKTKSNYLRQIALGLSTLHSQGIIHRDLKPENIMVTEDDRIKIIDLGLAKDSTEEQAASSLVGSLFYASPEQLKIVKSPVDSRSDLYSFGVIAYELCTGHKVTMADTFEKLCDWHASGRLPKFEDFENADLAENIKLFLEKSPFRRPRSASAILRHLGDIHNKVQRPLLVGRQSELEILRKAWAQVDLGQSQEILIAGPPGIGKSYLIKQFVEEIEGSHLLTLNSKSEIGVTTPLYAIHQIVDSLAETKIVDDQTKMLFENKFSTIEKQILCSAFPVVSKVFKYSLKEKVQFESLGELFGILIRLFKVISNQKSILFFVDDVQWLDIESLRFFQLLKREIEKGKIHRLLLIYSSRNDSESQPHLESFLEKATTEQLKSFYLDPLNTSQMRKMVLRLLGDREVNQEIIDLVLARSVGLPLATFQFVRLLKQRHLIHYKDGRWSFSSDESLLTALPNSVVEIVIDRLKSLSERDMQLLKFASLIGTKFSTDLLANASSFSKDEVIDIMSKANQEGIIERVNDTTAAFTHDRIVETIKKDIAQSEQWVGHAKIAECLYSEHISSKDDRKVFQMAKHLLETGEHVETNLKIDRLLYAANLALDYKLNKEVLKYLIPLRKKIAHRPQQEKIYFFELIAESLHRQTDTARTSIYLQEALKIATDPETLCRLNTKLTFCHLSSMNLFNSQMYNAVDDGIRLLSYDPLNNLFKLTMATLFYGLTHILGLGRLLKNQGESNRLLASAFEAKGHLAFHSLLVDHALLFSFMAYFHAHRYGHSKELAKTGNQLALVFATLKLRGLANRFRKKSLDISKQFNDRQLQAECELFNVLCLEMLGQPREAENLGKVILTEKAGLLHPVNTGNLGFSLCWSYFLRGQAKNMEDTLEKTRESSIFKQTDKSGTSIFFNTTQPCIDLMRGKTDKNLNFDYRTDLPISTDTIYSNGYATGSVLQNYLAQNLFQNRISDEDLIQTKALYDRYVNLNPFYTSFIPVANFFIFYAHCSIKLWASEPNNRLYKKRVRSALSDLFVSSHLPHWRSHYLLLRAIESYIKGDHRLSQKKFNKAIEYARRFENPWVEIESLLYLARITEKVDQKYNTMGFVSHALSVAQTYGFQYFINAINSEFNLKNNSQLSHSRTRSLDGSSSYNYLNKDLQSERRFNILKNLSLSLSNELDIEKQQSLALKEIISALGADRALIFSPNSESEKRKLLLGVNRNGEIIQQTDKISKAVINATLEKKLAVVYTGNGKQDLDLFGSLIAHDVRSVIAAPLVLGDQILGVIYCDNELISGVFSNEDIDILTAMANQVAFSMQMAIAAETEMKKQELERDLEVSGLVQSFLVPEKLNHNVDGLHYSIHYESASKSGGDWVWNLDSEDGYCFIIGDVTGHGVGAAMVTSIVAGAVHTALQTLNSQSDQRSYELFKIINEALIHICNQQYAMTCCYLRFSRDHKKLKVISAGCPPVFVVRNNEVDIIGSGGKILGLGQLNVVENEMEVRPGDRFVAFTDGLYEMRNQKNREFGMKRLSKFLLKNTQLDASSLRDVILKELKMYRNNADLEDDLTFAIIDIAS